MKTIRPPLYLNRSQAKVGSTKNVYLLDTASNSSLLKGLRMLLRIYCTCRQLLLLSYLLTQGELEHAHHL